MKVELFESSVKLVEEFIIIIIVTHNIQDLFLEDAITVIKAHNIIKKV